ncbi:MAG: hypothetical protein IPJ78_12540 [Gemmatimonadetes bacterium]|nr:hypothetical protein [Gemmatimonadota bacterium]
MIPFAPHLALALALAPVALAPVALRAQSTGAADSLAAIAVADSALAAITRGDAIALTDLMLPEARTFSSRMREGEWRYATRTRDEQRAASISGVIERGFGATALVSGPLAVVWMPYDLYVNGAWSHCGVDALTLYQVGGRWRIATFAWSVEQPPACAKHPQGPPTP